MSRRVRVPVRRLGVLVPGGVAVLLALASVGLRADPLPQELRPPGFRADVLVVGGSPAGVAAALAAARQGMVVVLAEPRGVLGTTWTASMLNMMDLNRLPGGRSLSGGIFQELHQALGGVTFDPRRAQEILLAKVDAEPGITLLLNTGVARPVVVAGRLTGAILRLPDDSEADAFAAVAVDATDDGDLAAAAGVPFTIGRAASGFDHRTMPATLMFRVGELDWPAIVSTAYSRRRDRQPSGASQGYVWGFRRFMRGYTSDDARLSAHDLNIGRLPDGTAWINSVQIHDLDATDQAARTDAYVRARVEVPRLLAYLRDAIPGFSQASLIEISPELYVRETRHLEGLYTLTAQDILGEVRFWDRIGAASYPIDLHQYVQGEQYPYRPVRHPYTIPLRALVAARVDGLFVASRAFSATFEAAGSARVVPTTIVMGEGVGVAAALCVKHGITPLQLVTRPDLVEETQRLLRRVGAILEF